MRWIATSLVAVLLVVLAACGQAGSPSTSATSSASAAPASSGDANLPTVRIAASRGLVSMPVWNLVKVGPKHGFNVEMQTITTYADQQRAAAAGDAEVATTGINMPAIIISNGTKNLRMIAGQQWGGQNLVVAKGVTINDWKDLEGKKIGVAPGTYARVLFLIAAEKHGVDLNKVDLTNIEAAGATALQALQRKELDGIVLFSPSIDQAVVEGYAYYPQNVDIGDVEFGDANGGLLANTDFLANKELASKFMAAYVESVEQMASDEDAFVALGKEVSGVTDEVAREAYKHIRFSYNIDKTAVLAAAKLGPQFGYAKQDFSSEVEQMLDFSLLTEATGKSVDELSKPAPK
jgi:sulfonate transport system substrate-binding protein